MEKPNLRNVNERDAVEVTIRGEGEEVGRVSKTEGGSGIENRPVADILDNLFHQSTNGAEDELVEELCSLKNNLEKDPKIFFDAIMILAKKVREKNRTQLLRFSAALHEALFSVSPSMINRIGILERIKLAAQISRIEELRGSLGQVINGELVYDLTFSEYTSQHIIDYIENDCREDAEDIINQLETIYADTVANGDWAERSTGKLRGVIDHFVHDSKPLTRLVAEVALERMKEEDEDPSLSVLTFVGNDHAGRLERANTGGSISLADKFRHNLPLGYKAIGIASDMIIGQDAAGMPRYAGYGDVRHIAQMPDSGVRIVQQLRDVERLQIHQLRLEQFCFILDNAKKIIRPDMTTAQYYAYIFDMPEENMQGYIDQGKYIDRLFRAKWGFVKTRALGLADEIEQMQAKENLQTIDFVSIDDILLSRDISPFSTLTEKDTILLHQCMRPEIREKIEEELGIATQEVPFRSLIHMLRFLSETDQETYERLGNICKAHSAIRSEVATAFFVASERSTYGTNILDICEKLDTGSLRIVLAKYNELVDAAYNMSYDLVQLPQSTEEEGGSESVVNQKSIIERSQIEVLKKARGLFDMYLKAFESTDESNKAQVIQNLERSLQNLTQDTVSFGAIVKALRGTGATYEQVQDVHVERKVGGQFSTEEKIELQNIFLSTREGGGDPEILKITSMDLFTAALDDSHSEFNILKYRDSPIAFMRYSYIKTDTDTATQSDTDRVYIGSFNISPEAKGSPVAATFLRQVMRELNDSYELNGEVWDGRPLAFYTSLGWRVSRKVENWHETGLVFHELTVPKGALSSKE